MDGIQAGYIVCQIVFCGEDQMNSEEFLDLPCENPGFIGSKLNGGLRNKIILEL
ncbi:hypothetical protein HanRHA438_Chr14g0630281 [Helianthus annuus]|nr:hypothetical protein HanRHA438_Chr14g0630281 [Helianthus annuus]